jgi:hypothetical protein
MEAGIATASHQRSPLMLDLHRRAHPHTVVPLTGSAPPSRPLAGGGRLLAGSGSCSPDPAASLPDLAGHHHRHVRAPPEGGEEKGRCRRSPGAHHSWIRPPRVATSPDLASPRRSATVGRREGARRRRERGGERARGPAGASAARAARG